MTAAGIPGVRGAEHVAFSVPDLDQAIAFFCDVLGCETSIRWDHSATRTERGFRTTSACTPAPRLPARACCAAGNGPNFEIFEFTSPGQRREMPQMSNWGGMHLAFCIDDMDAAIGYLTEHGIEVLGGKKPGLDAESGESSTFAHFHTPWGMLLELVSFPHGKTYMHGRDRVLWQPHHPEL